METIGSTRRWGLSLGEGGGCPLLHRLLMRYRKLLLSTLFLSRHEAVLFFCSVVYFIMIASVPVGASIDCFKCSSINGENPSCEDPFHNNYSSSILESPCMGGRKNRDGLFPATACIKLAGVFADTGETIMVRGCALDSGGVTTDTEIIRMSHCGHFYFEDRYVRGCICNCWDSDGCNGGPPSPQSLLHLLIPFQALVIIHYLRSYKDIFL